jgi:YD repeat-containing protein
VTGVTELDGSTVTYEYDDLARLAGAERTGTGAFDQAYTYDDANSRLTLSETSGTTTFAYDDANQLVSAGATTFDYDRNGNLTRAGADDLAYDPANDWTSGDVNGVSLAYDYDGLGRQVSRTQGATRTDFWFDASGMTLASGGANLTYLRDPAGLALSVTTAGGTLRNLGRDRLGSITGLVTNSGTLQRSYAYDPYGEIGAQTGTQPNILKFTAARQDPTSTWTILGQRARIPW